MSPARAPKPTHLQPEYGAQFSDSSVAAAYGFRPPYPEEAYTNTSGHARNGFSRDRMSPSSAAELDARIREIVTAFAVSGRLRFEVQVEVAWGVPG